MFATTYFPKKTSIASSTTTPTTVDLSAYAKTSDLTGYLKKTDVPLEYRSSGVLTNESGMDAWYWLDLARKHYQNTMPVRFRGANQWDRILTWDDLSSTWTTGTKLVTQSQLTTATQDILDAIPPSTPVNVNGMETLTTKIDSNFTGVLVVNNASGDITPNSVYVCTPTTKYVQSGVTGPWAWFRMQLPASLSGMTYLRVYNNSSSIDLRLITNQSDVVFVRGGTVSYTVSNSVIPPKTGLTLLFVPAAISPYKSVQNASLRVLMELDWVSDTSRILLPPFQ